MTGNGEHQVTPGWAAVALAGIDQSQAAMRRHTRWVARLMLAYGAATVVLFPLLGLTYGLAAVFAQVTWAVFLLALARFGLTRRVVVRGFRRLYLTATGFWSVLWIGATVLGRLAFPDQDGYWVAAGFVVAVPMLVAAGRAR